jgi:hypothetical protein
LVERYSVGRIANAPLSRVLDVVDFGHAHLADRGCTRPCTHLGDKRFDGLARAADQRLDRAVGTVAHPAGDAEPQRRAAAEFAIADALDDAADQNTPNNGASFGHGALSSP